MFGNGLLQPLQHIINSDLVRQLILSSRHLRAVKGGGTRDTFLQHLAQIGPILVPQTCTNSDQKRSLYTSSQTHLSTALKLSGSIERCLQTLPVEGIVVPLNGHASGHLVLQCSNQLLFLLNTGHLSVGGLHGRVREVHTEGLTAGQLVLQYLPLSLLSGFLELGTTVSPLGNVVDCVSAPHNKLGPEVDTSSLLSSSLHLVIRNLRVLVDEHVETVGDVNLQLDHVTEGLGIDKLLDVPINVLVLANGVLNGLQVAGCNRRGEDGLHMEHLLGLLLSPPPSQVSLEDDRLLLNGDVTQQLELAMLPSTVQSPGVSNLDLAEVTIQGLQESTTAGFVVALVFCCNLRSHEPVTLDKVLVSVTERIPLLTNLHSLKHTSITKLLETHQTSEKASALIVVWLDTTNVVRLSLVEGLHQVVKLSAELETQRDLTVGTTLVDVGEERLQERRARGGDQVEQILGESILVLFQEGVGIVQHLSSVVNHHKFRLGGTNLLEVGVGPMVFVDLVQESGIGTARHLNFLIESNEDTLGLQLNQIQHRLVINKLDVVELDLLTPVKLLLQLEGVLVEVLLELLVAEVDAKLLEGVNLKNLETKDIQYVDLPGFNGALGGGHSLVHLGNNPIEKMSVDLLGERVSVIRSGFVSEGNLSGSLATDNHGSVGASSLQIAGGYLEEIRTDV
mmetsp:Transcript_29412/g.45476  ORF Transcript_29412/g.45476 Transcript_29412/m.45476 type:complete len:678 (-) Transcript_29412:1190-3223(-)